MPIRINLLAEAQAAEELRRKDPVKKAFVVAGLVIGLVLFWSSTLQIKIISEKGHLNQLEAKWSSIEKSYKVAVDTRRQSLEAEQKIASLHRYTTNRFLLGTVLNALQKTASGNEDVQVVRLKTEQSYTINAVSDEARRQLMDLTRLDRESPADLFSRARALQYVIDPMGDHTIAVIRRVITALPGLVGDLSLSSFETLLARVPPLPSPGLW